MRNYKRCFVSWAEENRLDAALQKIPTEIERKEARTLEKWKDSSASADEESTGAVTSLGRTRATFEQATNSGKTFEVLSDFTFMDLAKCVPCVLVRI